MIHQFLRGYRGGCYRLCGHRSHVWRVRCYRLFTMDGFCGKHNYTCYEGHCLRDTMVTRMWRDHPWRMRRARFRYEVRILFWWVIHPHEMWQHREERKRMMSTPEQDKKNVGRIPPEKPPRPPKEYRDEQ